MNPDGSIFSHLKEASVQIQELGDELPYDSDTGFQTRVADD